MSVDGSDVLFNGEKNLLCLLIRAAAERFDELFAGLTVFLKVIIGLKPSVDSLKDCRVLTRLLQGFDAREWANRIYTYEHDVLYAFSIPATYGLGGRAYLCLRWQIIPQLALYFRVSETVYAKQWAASHSRPQTRTDLHLLLRAKL